MTKKERYKNQLGFSKSMQLKAMKVPFIVIFLLTISCVRSDDVEKVVNIIDETKNIDLLGDKAKDIKLEPNSDVVNLVDKKILESPIQVIEEKIVDGKALLEDKGDQVFDEDKGVKVIEKEIPIDKPIALELEKNDPVAAVKTIEVNPDIAHKLDEKFDDIKKDLGGKIIEEKVVEILPKNVIEDKDCKDEVVKEEEKEIIKNDDLANEIKETIIPKDNLADKCVCEEETKVINKDSPFGKNFAESFYGGYIVPKVVYDNVYLGGKPFGNRFYGGYTRGNYQWGNNLGHFFYRGKGFRDRFYGGKQLSFIDKNYLVSKNFGGNFYGPEGGYYLNGKGFYNNDYHTGNRFYPLGDKSFYGHGIPRRGFKWANGFKYSGYI